MISGEQLWEGLYDELDATDKDEQERIRRIANTAYHTIAALASFAPLRISMNLKSGDWLRADIAGIDSVYSTPLEEIFHERAYSGMAFANDPCYRWAIQERKIEPHLVGRGLTISDSGTKVSFNTDPAEDCEGMSLKIAGSLGTHILGTKATTRYPIEPAYYGPTVSGGTRWQLRPGGSCKFYACDTNGSEHAAALTMDAWILPPPLYKGWQTVLLPSAEPLHYFVLMRILRRNDDNSKANSLENNYRDALARAIDQNPRYTAPYPPQDRRGQRLSWGATT